MCILTLLYTLPVVTWAQLLCWSSLLLRVFLIIADCDASIYNLFVVILHNVGCMKTSISWCAKHVARISVILMVLFWLKCFPVTCHPLQRLCVSPCLSSLTVNITVFAALCSWPRLNFMEVHKAWNIDNDRCRNCRLIELLTVQTEQPDKLKRLFYEH